MRKVSRSKFIAILLTIAVAILWIAPTALAAEGPSYGPGRVGLQILEGRDHVAVGTGGIWNSRTNLLIQLDPLDGWRIKSYKVDLGPNGDEDNPYSPPLTTTGNPKIGHFDYKKDFESPYLNEAAVPVIDPVTLEIDPSAYRRTLVLNLYDDMAFSWGSPWEPERRQGIAIFLDLVKLDADMHVIAETGAWVVPELVTWIVETDEVAEESEVVVGEDVIADEATGEVVEIEVTEVKQTAKGKVHKNSHALAEKSWVVDEAEEIVAFEGGRWGWWFTFEMAHPKTGHFIDSPVAGLRVETPTYEGITDINAAFDYFPGEEIEISLGSFVLGSTVVDQKISPLDIFDPADTDDPRVINMARLIQSFDIDGDPQGGIVITELVVEAFEQAMAYYGLTEIDFANGPEIENILLKTQEFAAVLDPTVTLVVQSAADAKAHLEDTLINVMFRKNI